MGQVSPALEKLGSSRAAAAKLFDTIDKSAERRRIVNQNSKVKLGHKDCRVNVHGAIKFDNIHFKYASRDHKLFSGLRQYRGICRRVAIVERWYVVIRKLFASIVRSESR